MNKIFFIIKEKSERIINKNFQKISGISLYKISLYKFKNFQVFVDTDSEKIISECKKDKNLKHVYCYKRDKKFINMEKSLTQSPTPLMIKSFLDNFVKNEKEPIITSHVTSPFLKISTLKKALNNMRNYDSVCSCEKIQNFSYLENSKVKPINFNPRLIQKTQSLKKIIVLNGAFFIIKKNIFLNNGLQRISNNHFFYELTIPESLDIDYREHLFLARKLSKLKL
jgi:CMP-N-acetylneuraminic acid synthetase